MNTIQMCLASLFVVVAMVGCGPLAGVGLNGEPIFDKDSGSTDGNVLQHDGGGADSKADDGSVDNDSSSTDTSVSFCPPVGKPEATLEMVCADGPCCVVPGDEEQMAKDIMNAKFDPGGYGNPQANMMPASKPDPTIPHTGCATINDGPDYCFPLAMVYGKGYKPQFWGDLTVPFEATMYLRIKFPDSSMPEGGLEVALKECNDNICNFEGPVDAELSQMKVNYSVKTKEVTVVLVYKGKVVNPDVYKIE